MRDAVAVIDVLLVNEVIAAIGGQDFAGPVGSDVDGALPGNLVLLKSWLPSA